MEEEQLHVDKDLIHQIIERAFALFERGEFLSSDESRANMEKCKATWASLYSFALVVTCSSCHFQNYSAWFRQDYLAQNVVRSRAAI